MRNELSPQGHVAYGQYDCELIGGDKVEPLDQQQGLAVALPVGVTGMLTRLSPPRSRLSEVWLRREEQAARCAAMQAAHDAGDGEVVRLMLYGEAGPAAEIEAAAHGALWERHVGYVGRSRRPDGRVARAHGPADGRVRHPSTEDYLVYTTLGSCRVACGWPFSRGVL